LRNLVGHFKRPKRHLIKMREFFSFKYLEYFIKKNSSTVLEGGGQVVMDFAKITNSLSALTGAQVHLATCLYSFGWFANPSSDQYYINTWNLRVDKSAPKIFELSPPKNWWWNNERTNMPSMPNLFILQHIREDETHSHSFSQITSTSNH